MDRVKTEPNTVSNLKPYHAKLNLRKSSLREGVESCGMGAKYNKRKKTEHSTESSETKKVCFCFNIIYALRKQNKKA